MNVGIAQINPTVGDLATNRRLIQTAWQRLAQRGADLVIFPELAICGYPPRDLLFKSRFVADCRESLEILARSIDAVPAVIGFPEANGVHRGRRFYNSAAWCADGKIQAIGRKCLLPTYDVFDEDRYFEPAHETTLVEYRGWRIALTICEDIWATAESPSVSRYKTDPLHALAAQAPDLVVNLSASPWHRGKGDVRREIVCAAARACRCPVVYANMCGGNDELIFDGHSLAADAGGRLVAGLPGFVEAEEMISFTKPAVGAEAVSPAQPEVVSPAESVSAMEQIYNALVLGLRDYARKSGFQRALLGLSGGIDSALTAVLAARALGAENVIGISLPSEISSEHSREDARLVAANLGIAFHTLPIHSVVEGAKLALDPIFAGLRPDVTEENIQARSRGLLLMALSNKFGALLLSTGNKSEMAVGYCTLYGDMCGGLSVISDLYKTEVYNLAHWINREGEIIPCNSILKPPSAELRPGQTDQDSLPPYEVLDAILKLYVEEGHSRVEIAARGFDRSVVDDVVRRVDLNEYKRKQAAPGLKITPLAFGVGRRIPIVQRYVS